MEQFLIFLKGLATILLILIGGVCGITTLAQGGGFNIFCGVVFLALWGYLSVGYMMDTYGPKKKE